MRALAPAAFCLLAAGCHREGPEARLWAAFEGAVKAVEAGDADAAAAVLAPGFAGPEGLDRAGARLFLAAALRRQKVGVTVLGRRAELRGARAELQVELLLTGRGGSGLLPDESSRRTYVLVWELRDGDWKLRELREA